MTTTIVLIHGAYAESSSWNGAIQPLQADGHRVIAWANPLRGLASDATALTDLVRSVDGPVVLAGHSYGGALISNVYSSSWGTRLKIRLSGLVRCSTRSTMEHRPTGASPWASTGL